MPELSDLELIEQAIKGQDEALAALIQRYITLVYRFLCRLVGDSATAEDLAQETFLKAWKGLPGFDRKKVFKTWIFSIAKHTAIDFLRKRQPIPFAAFEDEEMPDFSEHIVDTQPLPTELAERADLAAELQRGLDQLNPDARSVVLMHETEELTFQEISEIMQESLNTVKSRYRRAILGLRRILWRNAPKKP